MSPSRWMLYPAGGAGIVGFVAWTILSKWPEGDPDGAREAATVWRSLAGKIDANTTVTGGLAQRVWTQHPSQGSEAFRAFWTQAGTVKTPGGVAAVPPAMSAYCRRMAEACEGYAEALEKTRDALRVMALTSYAQLMLAASWPWVGAQAAALSRWLIDRLYKKVQAQVLLKLLEHAIMKVAVEKLVGYSVGSAVFALGDEALALGARAAFGQDLGSFSDNSMATLKDFAACLAFFGVWDLTKLGPMGKVFRNNDAGDFASFYVGSSAYTVAYNLEDGKSGAGVLPTPSQLIAKLLIGTSQRGKDPGYPAVP
ncbi:WXG100-like domain-containing protein [Sphaerisporangium sp. NPDC004334]